MSQKRKCGLVCFLAADDTIVYISVVLTVVACCMLHVCAWYSQYWIFWLSFVQSNELIKWLQMSAIFLT